MTPLPEINWLCERRCVTDPAGLDCSLNASDYDGGLAASTSEAELTYSLGLSG
jgi:hypothetical protein